MKCKVGNSSKYFSDSDQKASLTQTKQSTITTTKYLALIKHFRKFSVSWFCLSLHILTFVTYRFLNFSVEKFFISLKLDDYERWTKQ